jgi:hypothetical protein
LGTVATPYYTGNDGLAHIHYAIHRDGQDHTVPFIGSCALEGMNLVNDGTYNGHANRSFVSSNGHGSMRIGSGASGAPPPARAEVTELRFDANTLEPGWNLVGWVSGGPVPWRSIRSPTMSPPYSASITMRRCSVAFRLALLRH